MLKSVVMAYHFIGPDGPIYNVILQRAKKSAIAMMRKFCERQARAARSNLSNVLTPQGSYLGFMYHMEPFRNSKLDELSPLCSRQGT